MTNERILYFHDNRRIDEVVGEGFFHLEQMDYDQYYLGLETADGETVQLSIVADGPIRVECYSHDRGDWPSSVEVESHSAPLPQAGEGGEF